MIDDPASSLHWVAFRVYVDGVMVDQHPVVLGTGDRDHVATIATRQADICKSAADAGSSWLVEVEFWDGEHVRWGTDAGGMVVPVEIGMAHLMDAIARRWA
jgi:hypothetical protein